MMVNGSNIIRAVLRTGTCMYIHTHCIHSHSAFILDIHWSSQSHLRNSIDSAGYSWTLLTQNIHEYTMSKHIIWSQHCFQKMKHRFWWLACNGGRNSASERFGPLWGAQRWFVLMFEVLTMGSNVQLSTSFKQKDHFFWLVCVCMWLYVYNPIKSILKQIITKHVVFQFGPIPSFYSHFWTPFLVSPSKSLRAPLGSQGNSLPTRWPRAGAAEDSSTPGRGSGSHWDSNPCWNSPEAESSELLVDWLGGWFKGTFWGNHGLSWSCPDQMEIGGGFSNHFLQQSLRPLRPWAHPKTQKKQRAGASILTNAAPPTKLADANPSNCGHIHHKPAGFNPSEKNKSQLGWLFPTYGKIKNVPNHQPEHN